MTQKIKTWFRWRYSQSTSTRATTQSKKVTYISAAPGKKSTRTKTPVETFQILFYKTKVRPLVTAEIDILKTAGKPINNGIRLSIQRRLTEQIFNIADEATLAAVSARIASDKSLADAQSAEVTVNEDGVEIRTPEQYQQ